MRSRVDVLTQQVDTLAEKYEQLLSDLVEAKRLNEMDASAGDSQCLMKFPDWGKQEEGGRLLHFDLHASDMSRNQSASEC